MKRPLLVVLALLASSATLSVGETSPAHAGTVHRASAVHHNTKTYTEVTALTDPNEELGNGEDYIWHSTKRKPFTISPGTDTQLEIENRAETFDIEVDGPSGSPLKDGSYAIQRDGFKTGPNGGIDAGFTMNLEGYGCNTISGRITIRDVAFDAAGHVKRLDMTYVQHCDGNTSSALFGQIIINEPRPIGTVATPSAIQFSSAYPHSHGDVAPIELSNSSSHAVKLGQATVAGHGRRSYAVVTNPCAGQRLAPGASCQLTVQFDPRHVGGLHARLQIASKTKGGTTAVLLAGAGYQGYTWFRTKSDSTFPEHQPAQKITPRTTSFYASGTNQDVIIGAATAGGFEAEFSSGTSKILKRGKTYSFTPTSNRNDPGVYVADLGTCSKTSGSFTIGQARYDAGHSMKSFAATFDLHCNGSAAALRGSVAWRAPHRPAPVPAS